MTAKSSRSAKRIMIRSVALPSEHGGWGFLVEPILLGLLVAFSWQGVLLAIASFGVFLIHQPTKLFLKDRHKARKPPRYTWAIRFMIGYGLLAVVPFTILLFVADINFLLPIVLAIPFALIQLIYDARNQSRHAIPEISGAIALAMIAPTIAILHGWAFEHAIILALLLSLRATPSILYVRARIRMKREQPYSVFNVGVWHSVAIFIAITLSTSRMTSWLILVPYIILFARAMWGLTPRHKNQPVKVVGFQEIGYGLLTVILLSLGYV